MPAPLSPEEYNYDEFVPDKFMKLMRFGESPVTGEKAVDFPVWPREEEDPIQLSALWREHELLIVEFGSFT